MATPVNNIAAAFSTVPLSSSSSSSSSSSASTLPSSLNPGTLALSSPPQPLISAAWNPHTILPRSQKSSFLNLYGGPGPSPLQTLSPFPRNRHQMIQIEAKPSKSISLSIGDKLPNATLSYLDRNNHLRSITVSALAKGKKLVLLGVSAPFGPRCNRFLQTAEEAKSRNVVDVVACVAMNDVFVMRAWAEHLSLDLGDKLMMLTDGSGELCRALGTSMELRGHSNGASMGLGNRSRRFCLVAVNGVVRSVRVDESDGFISE